MRRGLQEDLMFCPKITDLVFTDRKARRVRTIALFCTDDFARVEDCRRISKSDAIKVTREIHETDDGKSGE